MSANPSRALWQRRFGQHSETDILADVAARKLSLADGTRLLGWRPAEIRYEINRDNRPRRLGRWWADQRVFIVDPPWRPRRPPEPMILARITDRELMREIARRRAAALAERRCDRGGS